MIFIDMENNKNKSMHKLIMEEVKTNPILTKEELNDMLYFPTEQEFREEELMTESVCERIELFLEENGITPSKQQLKSIIAEERIKRKLL